VKERFRETDVEAVLQRLERLTEDETRTAVPQTLMVVYSLIQNIRGVIDGEKMYSDCNMPSI
jgi:hypothetical protein